MYLKYNIIIEHHFNKMKKNKTKKSWLMKYYQVGSN